MGTVRRMALFVLPLSACGELGLSAYGPEAFDAPGQQPAETPAPLDQTDTDTDTGLWDNTDTDGSATVEDQDDFLDTGAADLYAPINGTTWAMDFVNMDVQSPLGIDFRWNDVEAQALLLHVIGESDASLSFVSALSHSDGGQDACADVVPLPEADWSAKPHISIENAKLGLQLAGKFVQLERVEINAFVSADRTSWDDVTLTGIANARQLQGGLVANTTDICGTLAQHDNNCFECANGQPTCFTLEIATQALLRDIEFDPQVDQSDCL